MNTVTIMTYCLIWHFQPLHVGLLIKDGPNCLHEHRVTLWRTSKWGDSSLGIEPHMPMKLTIVQLELQYIGFGAKKHIEHIERVIVQYENT